MLRRCFLCLTVLTGLLGTVASAALIPEPDAIIYGTVQIDRGTSDRIREIVATLEGGTELETCPVTQLSSGLLRYALRLKTALDAQGKVLHYAEDGQERIPMETPIYLKVRFWGALDLAATPHGIKLSARGEVRLLDLNLIKDEDHDGLPDSLEDGWGLNPKVEDSDGDGILDIDEIAYDGINTSYDPFDPSTGRGGDLNALSKDTDLDGIEDGWELMRGMNPIANDLDLDLDWDGYTNWEEFLRNSDPNDLEDIPEPLIIYVDDNAEEDPNLHGDPLLSDPNEGWSGDPNYPGRQYPVADVQTAFEAYPFDSIQEAIDFAITNDTVCVRDGLYTGLGNRDIDLMGKAIVVQSESLDYGPGHCVIDCEYQGRGFTFQQDEDANTVVEGFTIVNGYADLGGGLLIDGSSPTIRHCIIADCCAQADGGGIYCIEAAPSFEYVNLVNNDANGFGGGLYAGAETQAMLSHSILWNNTLFDDPNTIQNIWLDDVETPDCASTVMMTYSAINPMLGTNSVYRGNFTALYGDRSTLVQSDPLFADDTNDFHLKSAHGRWGTIADVDDPNSFLNTWIMDDVNSPLIDAGDPDVFAAAEIWPYGGRVNIGAYGGTREASLSAVLDVGQAADLNKDGLVDANDTVLFEAEIENNRLPSPADLNRDLLIDETDQILMLALRGSDE
ncbi:hypothetical protein ACFL6U_05290 [Planctomycetota bacterium]